MYMYNNCIYMKRKEEKKRKKKVQDVPESLVTVFGLVWGHLVGGEMALVYSLSSLNVLLQVFFLSPLSLRSRCINGNGLEPCYQIALQVLPVLKSHTDPH